MIAIALCGIWMRYMMARRPMDHLYGSVVGRLPRPQHWLAVSMAAVCVVGILSPLSIYAQAREVPTGVHDSLSQASSANAKGRPADIPGYGAASQELQAAITAYRMSDAFTAARACREIAHADREFRLAQNCNNAVRGASYFLGDARGLLESAYWQFRYGDANALETPFTSANLAQLAHTTGPLSVRVDGSTELEYLHPLSAKDRTEKTTGQSTRPIVAVNVNGKRVDAMIDTGVYVPLMLDQAHAYQVGAVPLVIGVTAPPSLAVPSPAPDSAAYELVKTFQFGTLTMHNVLAIVVRNGYLPHGALVGLPALTRYKQVTFSATGVNLSTTEEHCPLPSVPMTSISSQQGYGRLIFPARVDNTYLNGMFDTGLTHIAIGGPKLLSPSALLYASGTSAQTGQATPKVKLRTLNVRIGKLTLTANNAPVGINFGTDLDIGAPLLTAIDVRVDFSKLSLCFLHKALQ